MNRAGRDASGVRVPSGHALLLYSADQPRWRAVAEWTCYGLRLGEKVIITGLASGSTDAVLGTIEDAGVDVGSALASAQLALSEIEDYYPAGGQEPVVTAALAEGWPAVRMSGPADQALTRMSAEEYRTVEARLDELCRRYPLSSLCQYDVTAAGQVDQTRVLHPIVADEAGLVATRLEDLTEGPPGRPGPVLVADVVGEFDGSNAGLLQEALVRAGQGPDGLSRMVLDLSGLRFLSVAAGRALLDGTAAFRARGGTVAIRGADLHLAQVLTLLALADHAGIELEEAGR